MVRKMMYDPYGMPFEDDWIPYLTEAPEDFEVGDLLESLELRDQRFSLERWFEEGGRTGEDFERRRAHRRKERRRRRRERGDR